MIRQVLLFCLLAGVIAVPAFALDDYPPVGAGGPTDLRSYIRVVNLLPGEQAVDFYAGVDSIAKCVAFGSASRYLAVMQGRYVFAANSVGVSAPNSALAQYVFKPVSHYYYTLVLMGTHECPQLVRLDDDVSVPGCGNVRLRLINALQPCTPVTILRSNGHVFFDSVPYGAADYRTMRGPICGLSITVDEPFQPIAFPAVSDRARVATLVVYGDADMGLRTMVIVER